MTKLAKAETAPAQEKKAEIAPVRKLLFPRWMERFEELFAEPWAPFWPMPRVREALSLTLPAIDMYEEGDALVVQAELPGLEKEDLEVSVSGNVLTISGKKEKEEKVEKRNYRRMERSTGSFTRSVMLPVEVELDKVTASYKDGVLEVRAPMAKGAEARGKKIAVS